MVLFFKAQVTQNREKEKKPSQSRHKKSKSSHDSEIKYMHCNFVFLIAEQPVIFRITCFAIQRAGNLPKIGSVQSAHPWSKQIQHGDVSRWCNNSLIKLLIRNGDEYKLRNSGVVQKIVRVTLEWDSFQIYLTMPELNQALRFCYDHSVGLQAPPNGNLFQVGWIQSDHFPL